MAERDNLVVTLKAKGITCRKIKQMIENKRDDASMFQKSGFNSLANSELVSVRKLKALKDKVCLLK